MHVGYDEVSDYIARNTAISENATGEASGGKIELISISEKLYFRIKCRTEGIACLRNGGKQIRMNVHALLPLFLMGVLFVVLIG